MNFNNTMNFDNACNILNLIPPFTHTELKKNYHIMALKYHPDKNNNTEESTMIFKSINSAYNYLHNFLINKDDIDNHKDTDYNKENVSSNSYFDLVNSFLSTFNDLYAKNSDLKQNISPDIIQILKDGCKNFSFKILEDLDRDTLIKIYEYIYLYHDILNISKETVTQIEYIVRKKLEKNSIIILNPSLKNLIENDIYKLEYGQEILYVPLWHKELIYDISNDNINETLNIKCIADIASNYSIDNNNNIHIKIHDNIVNILNKKFITINLDTKVFEIPVEKLKIKNYQTYIFNNKGISRINYDDILDIKHKADIYVHIYLS